MVESYKCEECGVSYKKNEIYPVDRVEGVLELLCRNCIDYWEESFEIKEEMI